MNQIQEKRYYEEDDEIDLMELLHTILKHKYVVIVSTILITLASLIGGQIYNKKKENIESKIILNQDNNVDISKASKNFKINNFTLEKVLDQASTYKVVTSKENRSLLENELLEIKSMYERKLIESNTIGLYSGEKRKEALKKYIDTTLTLIKDKDTETLLMTVKDRILLSERESLEEISERVKSINSDLEFYKDIILNYKLQNKELTFAINQNTIKFLAETLNSEDISYLHYRELLDTYIGLKTELNLLEFKIKNYSKISKEELDINREIERVNTIITELNNSKEEYIRENIDILLEISPIQNIFSGKPLILFLAVGIVLGGMLGIFLAFTKEFIKNYQERYSK